MKKILTEINKAGILLLALLLYKNADCQTPGLGTWNVINAEASLNKRWGLFGEVQLRSQKLYNHFSYHEVKAGVSYNLNDKSDVLVGAGHYVTYDPAGNFKSPVSNNEFRVWEQLQLKNSIGVIAIEHRFRVEQRFTSNGFRNRFRYRIGGILPIDKKELGPETLYLATQEEIFLTDKEPFFERSRFFLGAGYQFNEQLTLQAGWLRQFDYSSNLTSYTKNYLQLSMMIDLDLQ